MPPYVICGSASGLREDDLDAADLPVELACHSADDWARHVRPGAVARGRQLQGQLKFIAAVPWRPAIEWIVTA